jgi:hypothetical protein
MKENKADFLTVRQQAHLLRYPNPGVEAAWMMDAREEARRAEGGPTVKPQPLLADKTKDPDEKSYLYHSSARPGVIHVVRCTKGGEFKSCSCEGFRYRKRCWHKDDVLNNAAKRSVKPKKRKG